jgi:thiol-disulfide isomerase/thioredoxin
MKLVGGGLVSCLLLVPTALRAEATNQTLLSRHAQDLVVLRRNKLVPFKSDRFFKAPYTVLYFGAGWCPDCRRFSPTLVSAYDDQPKRRKRFEVLLLTRDKTAAGMLKFMRTEKMKWPAVAFDKMSGAEDLEKYFSGKGIPCLSVIDQKGEMVLQSKNDQDAKEVLTELERLPAGKR